jgi:hypothetical protein
MSGRRQKQPALKTAQAVWRIHAEGEDRQEQSWYFCSGVDQSSPVRTTGRWNSYEAKCMAGRNVPGGESLICQGRSRINTGRDKTIDITGGRLPFKWPPFT